MIRWQAKKALLSKAPDEVLDRLAHPDAAGNEAYRFILEHCADLAATIRAQTENANNPVTDVELRQARGALHVAGLVGDLPKAAEILRASRIEKQKQKTKQPEGENP